MICGAVADPLKWDRWPEAKALLEPARARGGFTSCIEPDEALYVALDGDELLAAATAWLGAAGFVEVKLLGGRDSRRWLAEMDKVIGRDAAAAGATSLTAWGRRGWAKTLREMGWDTFPVDHETNGYIRTLVIQSGNETDPRRTDADAAP